MISDEIPSSPFVQVATDLFFEAGKSFLVMVDCFSGWPMVHRWLNDPNSGQVIKVLKQWFAQFGIPSRLRSDGGPQYDSTEFRIFCDEWNITHQIKFSALSAKQFSGGTLCQAGEAFSTKKLAVTYSLMSF